MPPRKPQQIAEILLTVIGTVGIIAVALVIPQALQILDFKRSRRYRPYEIKRSIEGLKRSGKIRVRGHGSTQKISITAAGRSRLMLLHLLGNLPSNTWDKKWRLVLFDIPESQRLTRLALTRYLKKIGFYKLQRSAYLYPYECYEVIVEVCKELNIRHYLRYAVIERIEDENHYRRFFKLTPLS